jgi:hypothetical protein
MIFINVELRLQCKILNKKPLVSKDPQLLNTKGSYYYAICI